MMTSIECLAKAAELDAAARLCPRDSDRMGYTQTADGWRRTAVMAQRQEVWEAAHLS
jgi:hypothetical protein